MGIPPHPIYTSTTYKPSPHNKQTSSLPSPPHSCTFITMAPSAITPETSPERTVFAKKVLDQDTRSRASSVSSVKLNDGNFIPQVALGVYKAPNGQETEDAVTAALDAGYRHIDSAARYANEEACGRAIRAWMERTNTPREEIYVCSKLWDADHGYEATFKALCDSLDKFGLEYLDLYLIHSPADDEEKRLGKVRSIGVSNFGAAHIQNLLENASVVPAVNQVEVHPFCQRQELVALCAKHGIKIEAPTIGKIAEKYGKTPAQILLNWNASRGNVVLPKSLTASRIQSNLDSFDFTLDAEDIETINKLGAENYVTGSMHKSAD